MRAALLGRIHPHSPLLLATLERLPEVTAIDRWDEAPGNPQAPAFAAARKPGRTTGSLEEILAQKDLAFAVVCVRSDLADAVARRVLEAGRHLLAEKPVALAPSAILDLHHAARRAGVVASVLYTRRFHPCMEAARQLVQSGAIGPLLAMEARFLTTQVQFRDPTSWLFRRDQAGGGIVSWLGCHCLDLLHHVSGDEVTEVGATYATLSGAAIDVEDQASLSLRFRSGAVGSFLAGYTLAFSGAGYANLAGYDSYLAFHGLRGRVVWPDLEPRLVIETAPAPGQSPRREEKFDLPDSPTYGGAAGDAFFRRFFAALRGEAAPPTTLADAARTARIVAAAAESASHRQFVRID